MQAFLSHLKPVSSFYACELQCISLRISFSLSLSFYAVPGLPATCLPAAKHIRRWKRPFMWRHIAQDAVGPARVPRIPIQHRRGRLGTKRRWGCCSFPAWNTDHKRRKSDQCFSTHSSGPARPATFFASSQLLIQLDWALKEPQNFISLYLISKRSFRRVIFLGNQPKTRLGTEPRFSFSKEVNGSPQSF